MAPGSGGAVRCSICAAGRAARDGSLRGEFLPETTLGHVRALEWLARNGGAKIWNLGTGRGYSVLEVREAFEKASGVEIPYEIVDRRPGDVAINYADPASALADLGWSADRDMDTMCRDHWNWQKNNPNGYEG